MLQALPVQLPIRGQYSKPYDPTVPQASDVYQAPRDSYTPVLGTIGAGVGAFIGRCTIAPTIGVSLGAALGGTFGPIGATVGAVAGGLGGLYFEFKNKFQGVFPIGRLVGGVLGGLAGSALGKTAEVLHLPAPFSKSFVDETRGFTLRSLPKKLLNPTYTSHPTQPVSTCDKIQSLIKPGDVLITNNDVYMDFEIPERILGAKGDWTHSALYVGNGKVVEALGAKGVIERDLKELITTNHHAMLVRPRYKNDAQADAAIVEAKSHIGKKYDGGFSVHTDDRFYCIEHTWKSVTRGGPQLEMPASRLLKFEYVTPMTFLTSPDTEIVYSTGSGFFRNYLSKFD